MVLEWIEKGYFMNEREIKGISNELLCQTEFIKQGIDVSVPVSPYCKYDFIADIEKQLYRVQVKHPTKKKNGFQITTKSAHLTTKGAVTNKYTSNDIDLMCTFFDGKCYCIPIEEIENRSTVTLLFNNKCTNSNKIMLASDYLLDRQLRLKKIGENIAHSSEYVIRQSTLDGVIICEYDSIASCDLCIEDISKQSHISDCINGKRKSAYGYRWERVKI